MDEQKSFRAQLESEFKDLAMQIDQWVGRAEDRARKEAERLQLRKKADELHRRLDDLAASGDEAWAEMKPGLEKSWFELRESFRRARSRFRSSDEG
jgi:hypothetical protein